MPKKPPLPEFKTTKSRMVHFPDNIEDTDKCHVYIVSDVVDKQRTFCLAKITKTKKIEMHYTRSPFRATSFSSYNDALDFLKQYAPVHGFIHSFTCLFDTIGRTITPIHECYPATCRDCACYTIEPDGTNPACCTMYDCPTHPNDTETCCCGPNIYRLCWQDKDILILKFETELPETLTLEWLKDISVFSKDLRSILKNQPNINDFELLQ